MKISVRLVIKGSLREGFSVKLKMGQDSNLNIPPSSKNLCFCHLDFLLLELIDDNI